MADTGSRAWLVCNFSSFIEDCPRTLDRPCPQECDKPDHGTKFYFVEDGKTTGGQDWSDLTGHVLCKACYNRFSKGGTLQKQLKSGVQSPHNDLPRRCSDAGCKFPDRGSSFYYIEEGRRSGGRDWTSLMGSVLCQSCYSRYLSTGSIAADRDPARSRSNKQMMKASSEAEHHASLRPRVRAEGQYDTSARSEQQEGKQKKRSRSAAKEDSEGDDRDGQKKHQRLGHSMKARPGEKESPPPDPQRHEGGELSGGGTSSTTKKKGKGALDILCAAAARFMVVPSQVQSRSPPESLSKSLQNRSSPPNKVKGQIFLSSHSSSAQNPILSAHKSDSSLASGPSLQRAPTPSRK